MILPRISLTDNRKLPWLTFMGYAILPSKFISTLVAAAPWRALVVGDEVCLTRDTILAVMDRRHAKHAVIHWNEWSRDYAPPIDYKPRHILDAGCGAGETILLLSMTGCKKFTGVDIDERALRYCVLNSELNGLTFRGYNEALCLAHMDSDCDFVKIDVEGGEKALLGMRFEVPTVIEVHGRVLIDKFSSLGFEVVRFGNMSSRMFGVVCIMNNYKHLGFLGGRRYE